MEIEHRIPECTQIDSELNPNSLESFNKPNTYHDTMKCEEIKLEIILKSQLLNEIVTIFRMFFYFCFFLDF